MILLSVDTCGPSGSIALGRVVDGRILLLGQTELAGGEYAAALVQGIADLLSSAGLSVADLAGIVAVAGPGSFTGIRIGLSTVKALAEAGGLPVVTVSRLVLLADLAKTRCAALDAHRGQVFLGIYEDGVAREVLVTAGEFTTVSRLPGPVAFCEETVAHLLETVVTDVELARTAAPTAAVALEFAMGKWQAGEFADVESLDGYYLRGADAKLAVR
ncbi:tRNA (adenosine(37)-N6)-threonylcarbamoyltransferase complex dimerization subunit type 1 TsaB [Acidicapsa ligni]|uniref:tRNA (adenosine(37)-N6)-threonylcarbamoyltransferase complex dimerization subunit type 1 TsaB n=1 Tax=Acidicapsa ligni TaxID=542300 RepID=UPI0021E04FC4|nr:tRNA (adenosine(37)-N6)-threonylcarbamoyltransferase complex dimerization subunit type 1 TsaB [Acidicapsa ligni]